MKIGNRIKIVKLEDKYSPESYVGRVGIVQSIDSLGQLHGTWGGLAVIPEEDLFELI